MKEFKGTKGPWEAKKIHGDINVIVSGSFETLSPGMISYIPIVRDIDNKKNARLIAAAPELLEALIAILDPMTTYLPSTSEESKKAWAAINKALGEK